MCNFMEDISTLEISHNISTERESLVQTRVHSIDLSDHQHKYRPYERECAMQFSHIISEDKAMQCRTTKTARVPRVVVGCFEWFFADDYTVT